MNARNAMHVIEGGRADPPDEGAQPPHSIEAEQSILGGAMLDNAAWPKIEHLQDVDFYSSANREIFAGMRRLFAARAPVDVVTLAEALKTSGTLDYIGGMPYLAALVENVPTAANIKHYAAIVRDLALRRRLAVVGRDIAAAAFAPSSDAATALLDDARERIGALGPATAAASAWPEPLDLPALSLRQPQPPRFVLADWLPIGYATLLAGHGGVGKSAIGLYLAACIAMGLQFFGIASKRLRVLYLSCEDRLGVLHWRLAHICAYLGIGMADLAGWLDVLDLVGRDTVLWERDPRTGYTITPAFGRLEQRIDNTQAQVLVVDGVSDTFGGNENARTEVKRYVNSLLSMVGPDGALLLLGHVAKLTAANSETTEGYSGSTQWHNAVRARWYLYPETEKSEENSRAERTGKLVLELQKSNLGRIDQAMTFEWNDEARLFLATSTFGASAIDRKHRDATEQAGILHALYSCAMAVPPVVVPAAQQGRRTTFHVLSKRPQFPPSLARATGRFWSQIETLRQSNYIAEAEYRRSNRHAAAQFVLTAEGMRQCVE